MNNSVENSMENGTVSEDAVAEFLTFLNNNEEYLDSGLGAFHTDSHTNW